MLEFNATFFVAMFSFIIFMIMMNAILYKPITRIEELCQKIECLMRLEVVRQTF